MAMVNPVPKKEQEAGGKRKNSGKRGGKRSKGGEILWENRKERSLGGLK